MQNKKKLLWLAVAAGVLLVAGLGVRALRKRDRLPGAPLAAAPANVPRQAGPLEIAETLYDGKLTPGWDDWGWGPHQLGQGPARVKFSGYGGILLHHAQLQPDFGGFTFRYKAPPAWPQFLHVSLRWAGAPDDAFPVVPVDIRHIAVVDDGWKEVLIDWKELNPEQKPFDRVMIGSRVQVAGDWVTLDRLGLTKSTTKVAELRDDALRVECAAVGRPISEFIYGAANESWDSGLSSQRMGGNPTTRANWELGAWNVGHDWYFENTATGVTLDVIDASAKQHRNVAVVVPTIGWVAKDKTSVGFPRALFPAQRAFDPYKPAGDGYRPDGTPIPPGDPTLTSLAAPPELIGGWLTKVVARDTARGYRSVHMYILDNEPSLWNVTHRDVHPNPVSYDELLDRTIKYGTAIREKDPQGLIAGPAEWGWINYFHSAVDREAGVKQSPDRSAHAGVALVPWYLRKLAEHEKATGVRVLDVLDLHFYPAADGLYGGNARTDRAAAELRLRSTRALWDPSYFDESWIKESIRLIPRMKEWVQLNYPGVRTSIGEWNFGADEDISGGLATAEALGRFGQHGLDEAYFWGPLKAGTAAYWAFRAFRNFDGKGARFQDISLPVKEAEKVSLFASRDAATSRLVLVLVNRSATTESTVRVALPGCGEPAKVRAFSYGATSKSLDAAEASSGADGVTAKLAPFSFTVIDVELGAKKP